MHITHLHRSEQVIIDCSDPIEKENHRIGTNQITGIPNGTPLGRCPIPSVASCAGHLGEALHCKIDQVKRILEPATTTTKEERGEERVESGDESMGRRGDGIHSMKKWGCLHHAWSWDHLFGCLALGRSGRNHCA
jgi:hypothetical protein